MTRDEFAALWDRQSTGRSTLFYIKHLHDIGQPPTGFVMDLSIKRPSWFEDAFTDESNDTKYTWVVETS